MKTRCRKCGGDITCGGRHCDNLQCDWCKPCVEAKRREGEGK